MWGLDDIDVSCRGGGGVCVQVDTGFVLVEGPRDIQTGSEAVQIDADVCADGSEGWYIDAVFRGEAVAPGECQPGEPDPLLCLPVLSGDGNGGGGNEGGVGGDDEGAGDGCRGIVDGAGGLRYDSGRGEPGGE